MKAIALLAVLPLFAISMTSTATTTESLGKTTCTKVSSFDKRQSTDMPCSYRAIMGSDSVYAIRHIDFEFSNGDKISTKDDIKFSTNTNGDLLYKGSKISINDEPATALNIDPKTFKEILGTRIDKLRAASNPDYSNILRCFKPIDSPSALCVPFDLLFNVN